MAATYDRRIITTDLTDFLSVVSPNRLYCLSNTSPNTTLHSFPFSLPYSGNVYYSSGNTVNQGTYGYFWGDAASSPINAIALAFNGEYTWPEINNNRSSGFSVRCVVSANTTLHSFPFSLPYSGLINPSSGSTVYQGARGYFWSAATSASANARAMSFHSSYTWPEGTNDRSHGFPIRCVAEGNTSANNTLHSFPFSLPYSGGINYLSGNTVTQGAYGYFWSAAASSSSSARYLDFNGSSAWPEGTNHRSCGFSIRCVAK